MAQLYLPGTQGAQEKGPSSSRGKGLPKTKVGWSDRARNAGRKVADRARAAKQRAGSAARSGANAVRQNKGKAATGAAAAALAAAGLAYLVKQRKKAKPAKKAAKKPSAPKRAATKTGWRIALEKKLARLGTSSKKGRSTSESTSERKKKMPKKKRKTHRVRGHYARNRNSNTRHWVPPHKRNPSLPDAALNVAMAVGAGIVTYYAADKFKAEMFQAKDDDARGRWKWMMFGAGALVSAFTPLVGAAIMAPVVAGYFEERKALKNVQPPSTPSTSGNVAGVLLPVQNYGLNGVMLAGASDGYLSGTDAKIEQIIASL